jgi:hypothetical protein
LLWTFMGASEPYTMFVGFAEMVPVFCSSLVVHRRLAP